MRLAVGMVLLLAACGREEPVKLKGEETEKLKGVKTNRPIPEAFIDERAVPDYQLFLSRATAAGIPIAPSIELRGVHVIADFPDGVEGFQSGSSKGLRAAGVCMTYNDGEREWREVFIDVKHYEVAKRLKFKWQAFQGIMTHELGHCLLEKGHDVWDKHCRIMSPYGASGCVGDENDDVWQLKINEFFDPTYQASLPGIDEN